MSEGETMEVTEEMKPAVVKGAKDTSKFTDYKVGEGLFSVTDKGQICFVVKIEFADKEDEDTDDFFKSVGASNKKFTYYAAESCEKWFDKSAKKETINMADIPEQMTDTILQAIEATRAVRKNANFVDMSKMLETENSVEFDRIKADAMHKLNDIKKQYDEKIKKLKISGDGIDIVTFAERYEFQKHILIKGERGQGKTYMIDKYCTDKGFETIFMAGHEGIEGQDMIGYYAKDASGGLVWLDGALTEAFRLAQTQKVVLFIDEILRIPARELNVLVGSISPSSKHTYRLRTNRVTDITDGVGRTEIIEVPTSNLWIVATTNVGAKYNVDEIDHALSDRFRVYEKNLSPFEMKQIIEFWLDFKKFNLKWLDKFVEMEEKIRTLFNSGEIENVINIRHISEIIQFASSEDEFLSFAIDLLPNLCTTDMNGQLDKTEKELILKTFKRTLK